MPTGPRADPQREEDRMTDISIEFTIEPFAPDQPGPHVTEAIRAVEDLAGPDVQIEVGPFGTSATGPIGAVLALIEPLHRVALENGATRISVQSSPIPDTTNTQGQA